MQTFDIYRRQLLRDRFVVAISYMGIPFYLAFSIIDWLYVPSLWKQFFLIRGSTCIVLFVLALLVRRSAFPLRHISLLCLMTTAAFGLGIGYMTYRTGGLESPYYVGLNWVVIGSVAFFPLSIFDLIACIVAIFSPLMFLFLVYFRASDFHALAVLNLTFMGGACLLSVITNTFSVASLRREYELRNEVAREREQSESLLKEILPRYVIQRIKDGAHTIADSVSEVNVMFIDIVGFTEMSHRLAPKHLLEILGELFKALDSNCEKHGVTKIKTIGDAYMAATGAPEPADLSAVAAVAFCLDAIQAVGEVSERRGIPIKVRIGIATGVVISGVLSLKRPAYDLWGETVNLAARLESTSEPNVVHIAETTYWRVKDKYECEPRGKVSVRGIGSVQTYLIRPQPTSRL